MNLRAVSGEVESLISTRLVGHSMVFPLLAAWAVAREEKVPEAEIIERVERAEPLKQRMEPVRLVNGTWGIVDDRKAVPETIAVALRTLADLPAERKWAVMGEIGGNTQGIVAEAVLRSWANDLTSACDRLLLMTGDARKRDELTNAALQAGFSAESITAVDGNLPAAVAYIRGELRPGDVVLIKGCFHERLARVALALQGMEVRCWIPRCDPRSLKCLECPALLAVGN